MLFYEKKVEDFYVTPSRSFDFLPHMHHNIEIMVCLSGEFHTSCNYRNCTLRRGDMMIAFSNDIHAYRDGGEGQGIMIITNPQVLPLISGKLRGRKFENFLLNADEEIASLAEAICQEYAEKRSPEILTGYLYVLLGKALRELPYTEEKHPISTDTFSRVLEYLSDHYIEPVSLKKLARRFGVDPCYLSRMFPERLSYGFLKYLHTLRVEHAKNLLKSTDWKISDILEKSGFSDQKTFNRVFRELEEMTPSEYRNKQRNQKQSP